ncbi:DUF3152 domain-containing protein [Umezawaea beigongshangensis]|uniref:DUF3152 domain-containing protein n=1 Tax=Umezawaea beigongshangensis TaxID=2780383 RepID=UPI0018F13D55|nr:DUF3152 domain-containing protein [Umezawaea beigongshangensis]
MTSEGRGEEADRSPSASGTGFTAVGERTLNNEERYRRGTRRTAAEPLTASWVPDAAVESVVRRPVAPRRTGVAGLLSHYGWRVYAVPVLLVLTALVALDSAAPSVTNTGAGDAGVSGGGGGTGQPAREQPALPDVSEVPAPKPDLGGTTAELPPGPEFTRTATGIWRGVAGGTDVFGVEGDVVRYAVAVEEGISPSGYQNDEAAFASTIDDTLRDPRSWIGTRTVRMQRVPVEENPDFTISLTTPETTHRLCGESINAESSCYDPGLAGPTNRVVLNLARWVRGAKAYGPDLSTYRAYVINHEVGHALQRPHEGCQADGAPAPVMMQQTFGVANDYVWELNQTDATNREVVPKNGFVCTINPYPVPGGGQ